MNDQVFLQLKKSFARADVNYTQSYMHLFSVYEIWFRSITNKKPLREALTALHYRGEIWSEYQNDLSLQALRPYCRRICILTQHRPFKANNFWLGYLSDPDDWQGLIEYWYQIRCDLTHGADNTHIGYYDQFVKLAYESLRIFIIEILLRLEISYSYKTGKLPNPGRVDTTNMAYQILRG